MLMLASRSGRQGKPLNVSSISSSEGTTGDYSGGVSRAEMHLRLHAQIHHGKLPSSHEGPVSSSKGLLSWSHSLFHSLWGIPAIWGPIRLEKGIVAKSSVASIPVLGSARNVQTRFGTLISGSASPVQWSG